jgi:outer membrane lipoprotein-sorting protein
MLALPLYAALAQTPPDVAEILKKVGRTYQAAKDYELVAGFTFQDNGAAAGGHMLFAFKTPNRYRMEGALPGMGLGGAGSDKAILVDDGATIYCYLPQMNGYASFSASELTGDAPGDAGDMRPEAVDHYLMWRYRGAADFAATARFLREETIEIAGAKVPCYVVAVSPERGGHTYTWWVDQKLYHVLREDQGEGKNASSTVYTLVQLDSPPAAELFKFVPPPGARKIEVPK